jgi:hypothetical protein
MISGVGNGADGGIFFQTLAVIVYQLAQRGERYAPFLGESDKALLI